MKYVDLVIDNKSDKTDRPYTYICADDGIRVGNVVNVPFNKGNKIKRGYVVAVHDAEPERKSPKAIQYKEVESIEPNIILNEEMIDTALWIARRYYCKTIDAINLFIPAGSALKSGKARTLQMPEDVMRAEPLPELTDEQNAALDEINLAIRSDRLSMLLLHGVTGSGKTETYIRAVDTCIKNGKNAIILVPEISLTTQMTERFIERFGNGRVAILHSKMSGGQRYEQWMRIMRGETPIVIGARSAVFAPMKDIGIIIIDEEHESSYKSDMTPKYDTIEVATRRLNGQTSPGTLLLGSATPSVVTNFRANNGVFKRLTLSKRYNEIELPKTRIVDMREEIKSGNESIFSRELYKRMELTLDAGKQVILFLNRRGYSTFISCNDCGYVAKCEECDITLTHHKYSNSLLCHYCGRRTAPPLACPECGSRNMAYSGMGTEKLTEEVERLFPEYAVDRLDLDTIQKKGSIEKILKAYAAEKTDILIGTQLVTKGLDFKNVGLVGIVSADVSLNIPDYRSAERTFQLITQAAGRSGRGDERGEVIIQTYNPDHYAILAAIEADYDAFYNEEILLRKLRMYPPFSDIIKVEFSGENERDVYNTAIFAEEMLKEILHDEAGSVFPVQPAYVAKVNDKYQYFFIVKARTDEKVKYANSVHLMKKRLLAGNVKANIGIDINPY